MLGCAQIQFDQRVHRLSVDFAATQKGDSASDADVGWWNIDEIGFKLKKKDECIPVCLESDDVW